MKRIQIVVETILKGIGQIMLQDSAWTGILFLIAISYDSIFMGVAALASAIIGTATAKVLKFDEKNIRAGIYGFNATLFGVGLIFFFESSVLIRKKIPFFTFPFIVVSVITILAIDHFGLAGRNTIEAVEEMIELQDFTVAAHAYSEVIFKGTIAAGALFFLGVFVKNPTAALYGFVAAIIAGAIAHFNQDSVDLIDDGMFSFNAVLCGIACSGVKPRDGLYVLLSVVIATYFDIFMMNNGLITLTFPFVLSMWVIVPLKKLVGTYGTRKKNKNREFLITNQNSTDDL